ncbi:hypothetical protein Patl1_37120 [Pistacia atlantica]|nr:hypothetical protein Patl1_37120 [Pistacia atlantica]
MVDYQRRVELIQDLWFETATTKIKATPDGRVSYCFRNLNLIDMYQSYSYVLADDYSKLAFLYADRSVCLHAKYGKHYTLWIPRMGRDMAYDCWSCHLLCVASSPGLYRMNLEQGQFLSSLNTQSLALNVVSLRLLLNLVTVVIPFVY